jgi:glycine cleavage system H protein
MARPIPDDRLYSLEHEWVKIDGTKAAMGISDHAQCSLGDVVYVELPEVGREITQGAAIGVIESVKAVSDIFAPMSGVVTAVNTRVIEQPELINKDPYNDGWLIKLEIKDSTQQEKLLTKIDYQELLEKEAH